MPVRRYLLAAAATVFLALTTIGLAHAGLGPAFMTPDGAIACVVIPGKNTGSEEDVVFDAVLKCATLKPARMVTLPLYRAGRAVVTKPDNEFKRALITLHHSPIFLAYTQGPNRRQWTWHGFQCESFRTGVLCSNFTGYGLKISQAAIVRF